MSFSSFFIFPTLRNSLFLLLLCFQLLHFRQGGLKADPTSPDICLFSVCVFLHSKSSSTPSILLPWGPFLLSWSFPPFLVFPSFPCRVRGALAALGSQREN